MGVLPSPAVTVNGARRRPTRCRLFGFVAFGVSDAPIRGGPYYGQDHAREKLMDRLTFTVTEVAELLGISRTSAYECVRRGEIPSLTLGRRVVISRVALDALLNTSIDDGTVAS